MVSRERYRVDEGGARLDHRHDDVVLPSQIRPPERPALLPELARMAPSPRPRCLESGKWNGAANRKRTNLPLAIHGPNVPPGTEFLSTKQAFTHPRQYALSKKN